MSSRCASRPDSAGCRSRPRHGSARSSGSALRRSSVGISRHPPGGAVPRCDLHLGAAQRPERERDRVKRAYWQALDGAINANDAKQRLKALVDDLQKGAFTAAAKCLADDLDALVVHLRYPIRHRRRWRSTNLLERSLGEVKRRTKVMGRFPGETSCLTLVWAVLDLLITHQTNGINFNALDRQRLKRARYHGTDQTIPEEVTAA